MPEPIDVLRQAIATVRAQIPKGELTRASVEQLLVAAEAVCAAEASRERDSGPAVSPPASPRQEARERWARIARRNAKAQRRRASNAAE